MNRFPLMPLDLRGRLNDMPLREKFIERIFHSPERSEGAYYRWTELLGSDPTPGELVRFHAAHKLTLMAHSPKHYTELGRLVAKAGTIPWAELSATYGALFMEGLALLATRRKHANAEGATPDELPEEGPIERRQAGAAGPDRGLPARAGTADRAADTDQPPPEPQSGASMGPPAGVPQSLSQRVDAAESHVGPGRGQARLPGVLDKSDPLPPEKTPRHRSPQPGYRVGGSDSLAHESSVTSYGSRASVMRDSSCVLRIRRSWATMGNG